MGKNRTDSILIANYFMKQDKKLFDNLLLFIQKSRKKHIILKKIDNLFNKDTKKKMKKTIRKTRKKTKRTKNKI